MQSFKSIGVVEDDSNVRDMLIDAASRCGCVEWVSGTFSGARARLLAGAPDILLVDVRLPDGDGIELLQFLAAGSPCRALVVSALGDEATVLRAIEHGAAGYLLKDQDPARIASAIRDVADGGAPVSPRLAMFLLNRLRANGPRDRVRDDLTDRERSILDGLARGMSYAEMAEERNLSYHTINAHVKSIYRKLAVRSRNQAVYKALNSGIVKLS